MIDIRQYSCGGRDLTWACCWIKTCAWTMGAFVWVMGATALWAGQTETMETYDSLYNHLMVQQQSNIVSFQRMENGSIVSAIDMSQPERQVVAYTGYLFAAAIFQPSPDRVLSIGLGAGAINRLFTRLYPDARLVTVEIDPMILRVAVKHTGFKQNPNNQVVINDARLFLRRDDRKWDWIILDAFVKRSQIPAHLTTLEFYRLVSKRMTENGVVVVNLLSGTRLFESQAVTFQRAFSQVLFFQVRNRGNVVALGVNYESPHLPQILDRMDEQALPEVDHYGVNFNAIKVSVMASDDPRLNQQVPILTDDYAPVEFLDLIESGSAE